MDKERRKIWILENDALQAGQLKEMILAQPGYGEASVLCVHTAKELKENLRSDHPDVLIADIVLGGEENGITLVRNCLTGKRTQVIYLTGYSEYCSDVYETEHIWFLLKPVDKERLFKALSLAETKILKDRSQLLTIHENGKTRPVYLKDILYIENDRRKMKFTTVDGVAETYMKTSELVPLLSDRFVQCHRSFFVNMEYVRSITSSKFELAEGTGVPISQLKRKTVRERYLKYLAAAGGKDA